MPKKTETKLPSFRELTRAECDDLLSHNHVGRLAFSFHDRVDVEPVHYVYENGWLHGRTSPGTKLATLRHHPWVAFEVDEIKGLYDWSSVVAHGVAHIPDPDGSPNDRTAHGHSLSLIRDVFPYALGSGDPTPALQVIFRIHIDEIRGRAASTSERSSVRANQRSASSTT